MWTVSFPVQLGEGEDVLHVDRRAEQLLHVLLQDAHRLVHVHLLARTDPLPVEVITL